MASLSTVVGKIAERAGTVGLRSVETVPDDVNPPACFVVIGDMDRTAFRLGSMSLPFELVVLTSSAVGRVAQQQLYDYANPDPDDSGSVWAAFETNPSHGLDGVDVKILRYRPLGIDEVAAYNYYGGAFGGVITLTAGAS